MKIVSKDVSIFTGYYIAIYIGPCRRSYILLLQKFGTSEMLDKWSPKSKLSEIKWSCYLNGRYIFCSCTRARLSAVPINPIFPYLQIFLLWLNFDYMITCQLCRLRCKSATVYVLHNFSNVLAAGISPDFTWIFTDWVSAVVFPCVFSHWSKNKRHLEKSLQKMFLKTQSKICIHRALQGKMALFFNLDNSFRKIKWFV